MRRLSPAVTPSRAPGAGARWRLPTAARVRARGLAAVAVACALSRALTACADGEAGEGGGDPWPAIALSASVKAPSLLSSTGLVRLRAGVLEHHPQLVTYELTMPLFSDYALKQRALYVPPGATIGFRAEGPLDLPKGSIVVKTFSFVPDLRDPAQSVRPVETRVLVRGDDGWQAWPYIWNAATGDADLAVAGGVQSIAFIDPHGQDRVASYLVPQRNQCVDCHDQQVDGKKETTILGPEARLLHRDGVYGGKTVNQLQHLKDLGLLPDLPALDTIAAATAVPSPTTMPVGDLHGAALDAAARDYLHVNCAHCHSPRGVEGKTSQLFLHHDQKDPFLLGVCKAPSSAGKGGFGRHYDIVPGKPDQSILLYRLETTDLGAMMPDLGRSIVHTDGVALVRKWIAEMPPVDCELKD